MKIFKKEAIKETYMKKKIISMLFCVVLLFSGLLAGCTAGEHNTNNGTFVLGKAPKYVFMLIGDGMSVVQINAAQVLNGNNTLGEISTNNLLLRVFPPAVWQST